MLKMKSVAYLFCVTLVWGACDGTGGETTGGAAGGSGGGPVAPCPTTEPTQGDLCTIPALQCSFGESTFPMCRHRFRCDMGRWAQLGQFCEQEPGACMPSPVEGTACPGQSSYCVDGTKLCMCPLCGGAGCQPEPWVWSCSSPPMAGCPPIVPNEGIPCSNADLACQYGISCNEYARAQCKNGFWVWDPDYPCP